MESLRKKTVEAEHFVIVLGIALALVLFVGTALYIFWPIYTWKMDLDGSCESSKKEMGQLNESSRKEMVESEKRLQGSIVALRKELGPRLVGLPRWV